MEDFKLKRCPFCGGKGHISSREIRYIGQNCFEAKKIKMGVQIICGRCKARGGLATGEVIYASYQEQKKGLEPLENGAIEAWNRREMPMVTLDDSGITFREEIRHARVCDQQK